VLNKSGQDSGRVFQLEGTFHRQSDHKHTDVPNLAGWINKIPAGFASANIPI